MVALQSGMWQRPGTWRALTTTATMAPGVVVLTTCPLHPCRAPQINLPSDPSLGWRKGSSGELPVLGLTNRRVLSPGVRIRTFHDSQRLPCPSHPHSHQISALLVQVHRRWDSDPPLVDHFGTAISIRIRTRSPFPRRRNSDPVSES